MKRLFKKALRDLFQNKARFITALLAIIMGSVVFGSITFAYSIMSNEIITVFSTTNPASGTLLVNHIDDRLLELTRDFEGITDFEIKAAYELRMEKPDGTTKSLLLFSAPDLAAMHINTLKYIEGTATPGPGEVLLEADSLGVAALGIGDALPIRLPDGTIQNYTVTGTLNDLSQHPPSMHNQVYAYVSEETLSGMGLGMNSIDYFVTNDYYDRDNILQITTDYIHMLEENGYSVVSANISNTPGVSIHLAEYEGALFIFQVFSVLAFVFGCVIMSSLFSTMLAGQVRQIGILKSMGARTRNIRTAYMGAASLLVLLNLAVSLPLSMVVGRLLSYFLLRLGNMYLTVFSVPVYLYLLFAKLVLLVPLLLSYLPVRRGLSVSVKDALRDYGVQAGTQVAKKRNIGLITRLPRPLMLSLRSALEHRRRFIMNIAMLTLGGLLFVSIMGTIVSINTALSDNMKARHFDYQFTSSSYTDSDKIDRALTGISEIVDSYEVWGETTGKLIYPDGNTGNLYGLTAMSYDTTIYCPEIMEGRWLQAGDINAVVVSFEFLNKKPYSLGDTVAFQFGSTTHEMKIVGIVKEIGSQSIYMERGGFERLVPAQAQRSSVPIATAPQDRRMRLVYHELEEYLGSTEVSVVQSETKAERYNILKSHYTTTLVSFLTVAIMAVCVAGFGLASTMNLQVAERTQEIGIMKSMGAGDKQIKSIIRAESTFVCLASWVVSLILALPVLFFGIHYIGVYVLEIPLALSGVALAVSMLAWLLFTWLVGCFASRSSGKRAARMTVRAALVQE
ncbi:MAG: FtsX-like permease family protein [Lachnospiraceae bacterium]